MHEDDFTAPFHHSVGGDRRVDASRDEAKHVATDARGEPSRPRVFDERKIRGVIDNFHDHVDVGSVQAYSLPCRGAYVGAYFPIQFNGGLDKPFVRALGRDAKGFMRY